MKRQQTNLASLRIGIFVLCLNFYFGSGLPTKAEEDAKRFIAFIEAQPLESGEMTVAETEYTSLNQQNNPAIPQVRKYHAVWNGSNVLMEELTPQLPSSTNAVTRFLVGRYQDLYWHAVGTELNLFKKTNNAVAYDPAADNNTVNYFVGYSQSMVRKYLKGGFDYTDVNWNGGRLSAKSDEGTIDATLDFGKQPAALTGTFTGDHVVTLFRVDYLDWGGLNGKLYPKKYELYAKKGEGKEWQKLRSTEIVELKVPYSGDPAIFTPGYHIDTNYFRSYVYVSNQMYFVDTNALVRVRPAGSIGRSPLQKFLTLLIAFTILFFPLALWFGLKLTKHNTSTT